MNEFPQKINVAYSAAILFFCIIGLCAIDCRADIDHEHDVLEELHADETELDVTFSSSDKLTIAGTLTFPDNPGPYQCVVIAGGTLSHTRDGEMTNGNAPKRDALKRLAHHLADAGYASLRFDKRGYGESDEPKKGVAYRDQCEDLKAAMLYARGRTDVLSVIVAGESAGAYLACLAAKDKLYADGYMFLGGLTSTSPELYAYNFGRLKKWAESDPDNMAWAKQHAFHDLRLGYGYEAMFDAAKRGDERFTFSLDGKDWTIGLERKREELENEPGDIYQYIKKPALAIQGEIDMNVPPGDNQKAAEVMKEAGNADVTVVTIPHVDHNFQIVDDDPSERVKDRFAFLSFAHPYSDEFYEELVHWLQDRFPSNPELNDGTKVWGGVQVITDITDPAECPGVDTIEGRIGPLMKAEESQCHYIEMFPGQFTPEHGHSSESIIYTVKGQWVLCRAGHRKVMKPGTLYHFGRNIPTGYEVPFDESAYILIFKSHRSDWTDERFVEYLRWLKGDLEKRNENGLPFFFRELLSDHPARVFARKINPEWEKKLSDLSK